MRTQEFGRGVSTGVPDDPEGQWGTDGGQNQLRPRGREQVLSVQRVTGIRQRR